MREKQNSTRFIGPTIGPIYHSLDLTCATSARKDPVDLTKGVIAERTSVVNHTHRNIATHNRKARFNQGR